MNLEYKSGQRLLEKRFIERNLCGINIISENLTLFYYGIESRYTSSDEHCAVLSGHSRLYKASGTEVMFASIIRTRYQVSANEYQSLSSDCLLYTSPSPRDLSTSRMPSSA